MKMRLDIVCLSLGTALFLYALLGSLLDHSGNGAFLWLLVPSFLLVGIGGDRKLWRKTEAEAPTSIWFAPNS
jgi:hypothetical protein